MAIDEKPAVDTARAYDAHRGFIEFYWQTRLPKVDDLSAMFLGLAEEVGEFIEAKSLSDEEELVSEASDILFYMTGIFIETNKLGLDFAFSDIELDSSGDVDVVRDCFKLISLYNKSIRKKIDLDKEKFYKISSKIYAGLNAIKPLNELFIYNIEKLSKRDITGQNGTVKTT